MQDFLSFRKFITPVIIQILFWVGAVVMVILGLVGIIGGLTGGAPAAMLGGLMMLILGPIMVRIYCEMLILMFRSYDALVAIQANTSGRAGGGMAAAPQGPVASRPPSM